MRTRRGNSTKRRIVSLDTLDTPAREDLARQLSYVGSAHHKRQPGDYDFQPPVNPRPWKSICDGRRTILKDEAARLLREGILNGMFSDLSDDGVPKFVWAVDGEGEAYEAKRDSSGYHGYRLEEDDEMRRVVLREWEKRCRTN